MTISRRTPPARMAATIAAVPRRMLSESPTPPSADRTASLPAIVLLTAVSSLASPATTLSRRWLLVTFDGVLANSRISCPASSP